MEAKGNGNIQTCTRNLMRFFQGEIPYARGKGINPENIDRPVTTVIARLATETRKMIEKYEPRADIDNVSVKADLADLGYFTVEAEVTGGDD
jgi:phage baseplate assembly protein W